MYKKLISAVAHREYLIYAKEKKCKIYMLIAFMQFFHVLSSLQLVPNLPLQNILGTNKIEKHQA
jgi:hypothetical protein